MIKITEELDHFFYSPTAPHLENLDEGYFANLYNQIAKLEEQVLSVETASGKREQEMVCFIENMAHQIKNVLTSMQIQLDLLDSYANEKQRGYLEKCQKSVTRLTEETDRLLRSSQLAEGKIIMSNEAMNLTEETGLVIRALESIAEKRKVKVVLERSENVIYHGDAFWIAQAIENLIKNAIEHAGTDGEVRVSVKRKQTMACVRIEDSGDGIPEHEMEHLFRRFYRGSVSKSGYGIGLSMAQDVAAAHHGNVKVGNNPDGGAWFELNLLCMDRELYADAEDGKSD